MRRNGHASTHGDKLTTPRVTYYVHGIAITYAYTSDNRDEGYSIKLPNGAVIARTVIRDLYRRHLVTVITNSVNGTALNPLAYSYDLLNRVTNRNGDTFDYNARSEVISANIGTILSRYAYDNIGNNLWASANFVTNFYSANELNQYASILRASVPLCELSYDLDGNMTWDGRFNYTYDAENRLAAVYSNNVCVVSNAYDHLSRRVLKHTPTATHTYLYDGWNLVQETISTASGTTTNHYVWGRDLSGSMQGAGGVGGLLAVSLNGAWYFPFHDNNGNVLAYADETGTIVAEYTYDAFGRTIAQSGSMSTAFRHRFSTKYYDCETGLYYYGYRFYAPNLMRWLSRDLIGELGGYNLYGFVGNAPVNGVDAYGLWKVDDHKTMTDNAFSLALGPAGLSAYIRHPVYGRILDRIKDGNAAQDRNPGNFADARRHYSIRVWVGSNPSLSDSSRTSMDSDYASYLAEELSDYRDYLSRPSKHRCKKALHSLGLMSHSWQDFFAHAIRRDGLGAQNSSGGSENSSHRGWSAFTEGVAGSPDSRGSFVPCTWAPYRNLEHPGGDEPLLNGSREYWARRYAGRSFTATKYQTLLRGRFRVWRGKIHWVV